jgi:hypothetical protein
MKVQGENDEKLTISVYHYQRVKPLRSEEHRLGTSH